NNIQIVWHTGLQRLEKLDLSWNSFNNSILSSLAALPSLNTLILRVNDMEGSFPNQGFERLEMLDISWNRFNKSILSSLGALTSLNTLILSHMYYTMNGSFPIQELKNLKNLTFLDISDNNINGTLSFKGFQRLEELDLSSNSFNNSILSSLAALPSLNTLILSFNDMEGSFPNQGFERLEKLDISWNRFNKSILSSLGALTSLNTLIISSMYDTMNGSFPIQVHSLLSLGALTSLRAISAELKNLKNLTFLDISNNHFNGTISFKELKNLKNLTFLDISYNNFNGTLSFKEFSTFKRLETLNLKGNAFTGSIPKDHLQRKVVNVNNPFICYNIGLCGLKDLQHLDLSYNEFGGTLPQCLGNLTSLTFLDLSGNQLTGYLPSFWPPKLQSLDLSHNHLEGIFSFNYSSLEVIGLSGNKITFENGWIPSFQLKTLIMQDYGLESIPEFLFHQFKLELLDLSHNNLKGRFPYWLLQNNGGLEILNLMNNSFNGQLEIGAKMLPSMTYLNLARNHFEGDLFSAGDACKLVALDLSHNNFSGEVPERLLSNCIFLSYLRLSHNNFHGQIALFNLTRIADLQLNDNQFEGTLSSLVTNFSHQSYGPLVLHLSNNRLHGEIPHWIGNITGLKYLNLRNNLFQGQISCQHLSTGIEYLDLSYNSFSGLLPSCFNGNSLRQINLQGNRFSGSIPKALLNISTLNSLDLSDNELSGTILNKSGENLSSLRVLLLRGNYFSGFISNWLCQLNNVSLLDLSRNSFSGSIPHCLYNLSFGREGEGHLYDLPFSDTLFGWGIEYGGRSETYFDNIVSFDAEVDEESEFVTKYRVHTYKNKALNLMSGLDLSDNNLTGEIPDEFGVLFQIHALNLSHNQLTGSIPRSFSNLSQIESLDLSYNILSGQIPVELIDLNFLEVFSVAHNNLSGRIPDMKEQFSTFESKSYEGNPFLCGTQVRRKCHDDNDEPSPSQMESPKSPQEAHGNWYKIDREIFLASFSVTFIIFFLSVITILYVNSYWQERLIYRTRQYLFSYYYFLYDNLVK
ncbi:receptor-like protein 15, partial [Manihot esculenta]|uniref:receptor-like protein 15 n=1 Tax=Manihot esculenta TaxID=3983 RepID=UPI001CC5E7F6